MTWIVETERDWCYDPCQESSVLRVSVRGNSVVQTKNAPITPQAWPETEELWWRTISSEAAIMFQVFQQSPTMPPMLSEQSVHNSNKHIIYYYLVREFRD